MARGRFINKTVAIDKSLAMMVECYGFGAGLFHHRILAFLDVNGNVRADKFWLKATLFPLDEAVTPEDCEGFRDALDEFGLAFAYVIDGIPYLCFRTFEKNQHGLRKEKERPEFPEPKSYEKQEVAEQADNRRTTDGLLTDNRRTIGGEQAGISVSVSLSQSISKRDCNQESAPEPAPANPEAIPFLENPPLHEPEQEIRNYDQPDEEREADGYNPEPAIRIPKTTSELLSKIGQNASQNDKLKQGPFRYLFSKVYNWAGVTNPTQEYHYVQLVKIIGKLDANGFEHLIDDFVDRKYNPEGTPEQRFEKFVNAAWDEHYKNIGERPEKVVSW